MVKDVAHTEYQSVRSREVIFPCEEESRRRFYLRFADERHTWCDLPLAEMGTVKRSDVEAQTAEAGQNKQNIMIPIVPLRYTTPDRDPKQADLLRQNGYIYIFWGEEGSDQLTLWREVQVLESGKFKDINLQYYAGQDARPATARDVDNRLLLPYRLDGRNMQLAIAFADVQWSWAQINAFGGMAEDDFRIADFRGPRPPAMPTQEELGKAAELRDQRLQWVKLHGFADGFPYQAAQGQDAAVDNIANAPDLYALLPERQSNLPVVYLDDPLGIAYRLAGEYQGRWHEMRSTLAELAKQPHFQSATIVTQSLYRQPPEPPVEYRETPRGKRADPGDAQAHRSWSEMQQAKQKLRGNIDRAELERVLGVARRREIRERIAESKQALVDYLGEQHREGAVTLHAASDDYVRLPAEKAGAKNANPHYGCLWDCWEKLIAQLADTPHTLDLALELDQPSDEALAQETEQDPGRRFLAELMSEEQKHEIQRRLLPNENDNEYFRDDAFVASLAISRNTVKFVSGFLSHYTEGLIQKIIQSEKNKIFTLLHRGNLELEDLNRPTVDFYNTKTRKLVKPEGYIFLTQVIDANLTRSGADDIPQNQRSLPVDDGHRARLSYQDEASGAVMAATGGRALQGRLTLGWERLLG
ncbi:MAG: hypothetical protein SVU69_10190, partial [Pseudomonadota bacterium]|nr:hypothetical protein [Pseudomonadota bacterium]